MYSESFKPSTTINGHVLNVVNDVPDFRDRMYQPTLLPLAHEIEPDPAQLKIFDQGSEGSCTGHGLAAVINLLLKRQEKDLTVSRRMLYEMAKKHDKWPGEKYEGSSCRGAIKGWYHTGVCEERFWEYSPDSSDTRLNPERAMNARNITIGAYYRLNHDIVDFHCALNETGALYVSADVHAGWLENLGADDEIRMSGEMLGGHAFAIVGYNDRGFWVQNSWGKSWGRDGLALWTYEDWQTNIKDGWVLRLAVSTPQIHRGASGFVRGISSVDGFGDKSVSRIEIAGHFAHVDDGKFHDEGRFWSDKNDVDITTAKLGDASGYDHFLLYCHGGLNSPKDSARRIKAMTPVFKANNVYNYHFMYDTGLVEELKDIITRKKKPLPETTTFSITDISDKLIEKASGRIGRALWTEMKNDAAVPFNENLAGTYVVDHLVSRAKAKGLKIHIIGHSNGSVMAAFLIDRLLHNIQGIQISTLSLMAPACTYDLFTEYYTYSISNRRVEQASVYNLSDRLEQDDNVAEVYRKSLLYLVSNAYESGRKMPLLGMEKFKDHVDVSELGSGFEFVVSRGEEGSRTASRSHGGFDNDVDTLNDILKRVTGSSPVRPFKKTDLDY